MFITKLKKLFVKKNFFIICCIFFFLIFFKAFISSNGYLMPDSEWYLIAANNILDLKFLFFDELEIYGVEISKYKDHGRFLSAWPPLYALSISLVSFFINIDVYLASKVLNFFCLLVIFFILKKYISSNFVIFFIFCNATFLEIYFYTLSEYLFITLMMILAHNLNIYLTKENNFNLLVIFIILNLLFFTKLVGLFANLAIVFLFLYFFLI